jgi:hypothetical protein
MTVRIVRKSHSLGALLFAVREHGLKALDDPRNAKRLARLDPETRAEVDAKIREIVDDRLLRMKQEAKQQRPRPRRSTAR